MPVGCEAQIKGPDGKHIGSRQAITYLGSVIAANGSINSELNRRLGMAKGDFDALNRVWKHANLGLKTGDFLGMCDFTPSVLSPYCLVAQS